MEIDKGTRLIDLTAGELEELIAGQVREAIRGADKEQADGGPSVVYGIAGIASLFGCSLTQANRIKQSGIISPAITQVGKLIVVDARKALTLARKYGRKTPKYKY